MPGQFDESKHPRDGGKFSSKPGAGGKKDDPTKVKDMGDVDLKKKTDQKIKGAVDNWLEDEGNLSSVKRDLKSHGSFNVPADVKRSMGVKSYKSDSNPWKSWDKTPENFDTLTKAISRKTGYDFKKRAFKKHAELGDKMMRRLNTDDAGAKASSGYAGVAKKPLDTAQHNFFTKQIGRLEKISQRLDRAVASGNYDKLQLALDKNEEMGKISRNFSGINILSEGSLDRDTMNRLEDVIRSTGNHMGNSTWDGQGDHEYYKKVAVDNANKLHQVLDTLSGKQKSSDALYGEMWSGSMSNINTKMNTLKLASMKLQVKS